MHERGVVVSLTCTKENVALNLIESLRSTEAMGSVGSGSLVTCLGNDSALATGESFSRRNFGCLLPRRLITSYAGFHYYWKNFFFQLKRHSMG
jgi:hypothetical protein